MSEYGRKEARFITGACLVLAGTGVASAVSPAVESALNWWVGLPVAVVAAALGLGVLGKQLWSWLLVQWEMRRGPGA